MPRGAPVCLDFGQMVGYGRAALDWCRSINRRFASVLFGGIGSPDRMTAKSAGPSRWF
jgi:hypothetical protein